MAACGAQACAEEKVDKPKRMFNYKPLGRPSPDYKGFPEDHKHDTVEEFATDVRTSMAKMFEPSKKIPILVEAMEKTINSEFKVKKGKISDGDVTVYVHRPKTLPEKRCPAMIFAHGGGFVGGTGSQFVPFYALMSLSYGVVGFNVDYRLAPEHGNKGGADVYAALKYVYDNAEKLGIDKSRIGLEGSSAGSHHVFTAINIMIQEGEKGMCKMILSEIGFFSSVLQFSSDKEEFNKEEVTTRPDLKFMYQALFGDDYKEHIDNKNPMMFTELVEDEKLKLYPPIAIFSAEFCPFHKGNEFLAKRLEEMGKLLEFRLIPGFGHMYSTANTRETQAVYVDRIACVKAYLIN